MKMLLKKIMDESELSKLVDLNFLFHHRIALSTHNTVYTLIDKSFEPVSKNIIRFFYQKETVVEKSKRLLSSIYQSIEKQDAESAAQYTSDIFNGAEHVLKEKWNQK